MAGPGRACSHVIKTATLAAHQQTRAASTRTFLTTATSHHRLQGQSTKVTTAPRKQLLANTTQRGYHLLSTPRSIGIQASAISSRAILSITDARRFMSTVSTDSEDSSNGMSRCCSCVSNWSSIGHHLVINRPMLAC